MKLKTSALFLALLIGFASCRKDRDDENSEPQLMGLAAFLNGEFDVTQADYNGSFLTPFGQSIPLNGTGDSTEGYYIFNANAKTVDYSVSTSMELSILTQTIRVPVLVAGNGDVDYVSETRFTINDDRYGLMTYDVSNQTATSLRATTRYEADTAGGEIDLLLDVYLEKK